MNRSTFALLASVLLVGPALAQSQTLPRIASLYPPGAQAGQTVEVSIRGGGLEGAREVLVTGSGLSVKLNAADVKVDPADQKVFTSKCALCHDLRGPATISRTADQWVATVDRMIKDRGAPIEAAERTKIVNYVQAAARASAGLTARISIAADAAPGRRELRVVGANGTSTVFPFEVTRQTETLEVEPNNEVTKAPVVQVPLTVSGQIGQSDQDCFAFNARKGERLVFNCSAYRLREANQDNFYPVLYLYDEKGRELAKNTGYFSLDPLIDWTAPADGKYVIAIRDMLYRGSPASVYRLSMGSLPYRTFLYPPGVRRGTALEATVSGENMTSKTLQVPVDAKSPLGVREIDTPEGPFKLVVGEAPECTEQPGSGPQPVTLPVSINGKLDTAGPDRYTFTLAKEQLGAYAFEMYADRIDSPIAGRITLLDGRGRALANNSGGRRSPDPRIDYTFTQPGEYTLVVEDEAGKYGPSSVYRIHATAATPDFQATISPDNANVGPGSSVLLPIRIRRKVGVTSPISIVFPELPQGVTASPTMIQPDQNQAFVVLTAAADAPLGAFRVVRPVARMEVDGKTVEREITPNEVYLINNNQQPAPRTTMVVSVATAPDWSVSLEPASATLSREASSVEVKVKLNRNGAQRDMPFAIVGAPQGIQAPGSLLFRKNQDELTFTLRASPQVFTPRPNGPTSYQFLLSVVSGREGEGMQFASKPIPVTVMLPPGK